VSKVHRVPKELKGFKELRGARELKVSASRVHKVFLSRDLKAFKELRERLFKAFKVLQQTLSLLHKPLATFMAW
jgi:hypothetical protein